MPPSPIDQLWSLVKRLEGIINDLETKLKAEGQFKREAASLRAKLSRLERDKPTVTAREQKHEIMRLRRKVATHVSQKVELKRYIKELEKTLNIQ